MNKLYKQQIVIEMLGIETNNMKFYIRLPLILRKFDNEQLLEFPWKDLFNGQIKFSQGMKLFHAHHQQFPVLE